MAPATLSAPSRHLTASRTLSATPRHISTEPSHVDLFTHGLTGVDQDGNYMWVHVTLAFFAVLCVSTLLLRLAKMGFGHLRHITLMGTSTDRQAFWADNQTRWWPKVKRYVLYAPLWHVRHNREIQLSKAITIGTLPSRFHAFLLLAYVCSNVAYCLVLPWGRPNSASVLAAFRGRTGTLAAINLIPTILFALRNNPLIPLLHVSYDTFNLLHRWAARLVIIESICHTAAWMANAHKLGGWPHIGSVLSVHTSYQWAMLAMVGFAFMGLQALSPIRHAFYETFLNVHRLCAVATLVGVYLHIDLDKLPQLPWITIAITLWALEWAVRAFRLAYHNVARQPTRVTVEALPAEACRVTFELARPWHVTPGTHVHAYIPALAFWSSHPFSVAWTHGTPSPSVTRALEDAAADEKGGRPTADDINLDALPEPSSATSLSLVVRARTGMTRKLFARASAAPNGRFTTFGAIEGPYGGHQSLHSYGTVVLFAGGVGITHAMGHMRDLVAGHAAGTVAARKVLLVWSVPSTEALEWVRPWMDEILRLPRRRDVLRMQLFVTRPRSRAEVVSATGTIQMFPGRCNPQMIVDREIYERTGAVAITVCGPGAFSDSVRDAARKRVELGCVDFIEEAFTY